MARMMTSPLITIRQKLLTLDMSLLSLSKTLTHFETLLVNNHPYQWQSESVGQAQASGMVGQFTTEGAVVAYA